MVLSEEEIRNDPPPLGGRDDIGMPDLGHKVGPREDQTVS